MCRVPHTWTTSNVELFLFLVLLDKVLLGDDARAEIANPVHRNNSNVLNCTQQILGERALMEMLCQILFQFSKKIVLVKLSITATLKEMR